MNALATLCFSLKIVVVLVTKPCPTHWNSMVVLVTKPCPTHWNSMDCSRPGSSVHGILQARILEWVAILFSRGSSLPRDWTHVSRIAGRFFTVWVTREAPLKIRQPLKIALKRNSKSEAPTALVLIINLQTDTASKPSIISTICQWEEYWQGFALQKPQVPCLLWSAPPKPPPTLFSV